MTKIQQQKKSFFSNPNKSKLKQNKTKFIDRTSIESLPKRKQINKRETKKDNFDSNIKLIWMGNRIVHEILNGCWNPKSPEEDAI